MFFSVLCICGCGFLGSVYVLVVGGGRGIVFMCVCVWSCVYCMCVFYRGVFVFMFVYFGVCVGIIEDM